MSGVEIVGFAASVLQIADLGWKVSYKLFAFSRKVHHAGKSIDSISRDMSATGMVLQQLGEELKKDGAAKAEARLCSKTLVDSARGLVEECTQLFKDLEVAVDGGDGNKVILGLKQKLKWSFLEPKIDLLRTRLEGLKVSLAVMLNVLIYAEQLRCRQDRSVLAEQQNLVTVLTKEKTASEHKMKKLKLMILANDRDETPTEETKFPTSPEEIVETKVIIETARDVNERPRSPGERHAVSTGERTPISRRDTMESTRKRTPASRRETMESTRNRALSRSSDSDGGKRPSRPSQGFENSPYNWLEDEGAFCDLEVLHEHFALVEQLLEEISSNKYSLDVGTRGRLHDGILQMHSNEWLPFRPVYGDKTLIEAFSRHPAIMRNWMLYINNGTYYRGIHGAIVGQTTPPQSYGERDRWGRRAVQPASEGGQMHFQRTEEAKMREDGQRINLSMLKGEDEKLTLRKELELKERASQWRFYERDEPSRLEPELENADARKDVEPVGKQPSWQGGNNTTSSQNNDTSTPAKSRWDEAYQARLKQEVLATGYSEENVDSIIRKRKENEQRESLAFDLSRPTYIKCHKKYLSTETLDHYGLPWEWDQRDPNYMIIKEYVNHDLQDELFEDTRKMRAMKRAARQQMGMSTGGDEGEVRDWDDLEDKADSPSTVESAATLLAEWTTLSPEELEQVR